MNRIITITLIAAVTAIALTTESLTADTVMWVFADDTDAVLIECPRSVLIAWPDAQCATLFGSTQLIRMTAERWVRQYSDINWWGPWTEDTRGPSVMTFRFFIIDPDAQYTLLTYEREPFDSIVIITGPRARNDD